MSQKGYIYKLVIKDGSLDDCYIGSTMNIKQRKHRHKSSCNKKNGASYNFYVYHFIRENQGFENWCMVILEEVEFDNKINLKKRERYYIETVGASLNRHIPTRTNKEWRDDNKDVLNTRGKIYRETNKESINRQRKEYRDNNKEMINIKNKENYENNKEDRKASAKAYREGNKEIIKEKDSIRKKIYRNANKEQMNITIKCDACGELTSKSHISRHKQSKKCKSKK